MGSTLVNVRLDPERRRKARVLRARGITLADVVREAIDDRFRALDACGAKPDVRALITQLFAEHPDPADLLPRDYDVHDRQAARQAIRRRIGRSRA